MEKTRPFAFFFCPAGSKVHVFFCGLHGVKRCSLSVFVIYLHFSSPPLPFGHGHELPVLLVLSCLGLAGDR